MTGSIRALAAGVCAAALLAFTPTTAPAQSLADDLSALVANHPAIQAKQKNTLSAGEAIRAARSGYLPTVKASGDAGPEYVNNPTRRQTNNEAYFEGRETAGLTVTQKIFDGFATSSSVDSAAISRQISEADLRATRQTTMLEGTLAYINVLRFTKLIHLARDNERKVQEQLNLEDERVQKGSGIASDVLDAKQRLQTSKEKRVKYEGNFQEAVAAYTQVYGRAPDVAKLADPVIPAALLPATLDDALKIAESDNPTLEQTARTVELNAERRRTAEAGYYPTLDLIGKANYENDKNALPGIRRDWSLLLTANWELFSGFKTDALVAQASYDHAASKDTQFYSGRKVAEAVRKAWHKLKVARERTSLLENAAVLAEEVWEARKKQREAGKATVTDVLDQETRVDEARINYTDVYYESIQAAYELLTAMGRFEVENITLAPAPAPRGAQAPAKTPAKAQVAQAKPDLTQPLAANFDEAVRAHVEKLVQDSSAAALSPGLNPTHYRR